jgi:hypothetical protein
MRRLAAQLALAAIYATLLAPFTVAGQQASLHACCLRTGMHHCQTDSHEAGLHSATNSCPYSTPPLLASHNGIQAAEFHITSPAVTGFVIYLKYHSHSPALVRDAAARAPPVALL